MTGVFYLKCMGLPELRAPNGRVARMRGRKHLALLIYLAVERRSQYSRDELAHLLWAGAPMAEARHSLATGASAIRRALGPSALEGNREVLRLRHDLIRLDLDRLESGELFATPELPAIEVDAFLHGFEIRDSQEYMLWRDRQQAKWLPGIHAALLRLIDHSRRTGASRVIGTLADRLLAIDELSEDGVRAKMEALAFAGDRIAALRVFEEWRDRLKVELDAVPAPLLEEMARRLRRRGLERPVADTVPSVQTDPWRDRPFVGRATEYRRLYESWESTLLQSPRHALVEGESGIGKSTLVERFSMAAALEGAVVSRVQCYELERTIPFAAVAALVSGLIDKPGASSTDPAALAEVARVAPRVRERFPGLPAPRDSQGETARLHFAEGVLALLEAVMEEHPVVVVVDDFHLADEVSLTVLHLLIRRLERVRMMVLLTMRTSELQPSSGAARIHGGGEYLRMTHLRLPPLDEAESAELLSGLVPKDRDPPTPSERHILLQAARGVPMVLQLLVEDWQRRGSASLALSARSMTAEIGSEAIESLEGAYRHIVTHILLELDPMTRLVLQAATVLGSRINELSLYHAADLTGSQVMIGMAELTQRHILKDSPSGLDFVNELVRNQAYAALPSALRLALHCAVAERLVMRLASGEETVHGLETAWHLVRGGRGTEASPHLLRGARQALREGAPHEAELALATALVGDVVLSGVARIEAILLHAEILQELSLWRQSIEALDTLPQGLSASMADQANLLRIIAEHHIAATYPRTNEDRVVALLGLAADSQHMAVKARSIMTAARFAEELQSHTANDSLWRILAEMESANIAPESRADLLVAHATLHYSVRQLDKSVEALDAAMALLKRHGVSNTVYVNIINSLSALHCANGRYAEAEIHAKEAFRLALRLDNVYLARKASVNLSVAAGRQGMYRQQEHWGRQGLDHAHGADHYNLYMRAATSVAEAKAMLNERDALTEYHELLAKAPPTSTPWGSQAVILNEADILQLLGQKRRSRDLGRLGTSGENRLILNRGWTGKFLRWLTVTSIEDNTPHSALEAVRTALSALSSHDAFDQVEISCCFLMLQPNWSAECEFVRNQALRVLAKLPPAVADWLERLDILEALRRDRMTMHGARRQRLDGTNSRP